MRYRRFGRSDLLVSEVGLGTWTLASDWWGHVDDPDRLLHAALDAGITFIDTAPVYGKDGIGETLLAPLLAKHRDELVLTTKCGYDLSLERKGGGQNERPQDWKPKAVRDQLEESLSRLGTDRIDLYQLHNARIEPVLDDDLWAELEALRSEGKVRELGVALGPAIGWVEEGVTAVDTRPIVSLQTVFNVLEQEPGLTFATGPASPTASAGSSRAFRTRPTRSRAGSRPTRCSSRPTIARTATATTCSTTSRRPRRSRSSGSRRPAARSVRPRSPASSPTPRSRPCSRPS